MPLNPGCSEIQEIAALRKGKRMPAIRGMRDASDSRLYTHTVHPVNQTTPLLTSMKPILSKELFAVISL